MKNSNHSINYSIMVASRPLFTTFTISPSEYERKLPEKENLIIPEVIFFSHFLQDNKKQV